MVRPLYQTYLDMRAELESIEVPVPDYYKENVINRVFPKKCFEKAYEYVNQHDNLPNIKYVEGVYAGLLADHAWVEIDHNIVFDGTLQRFYDKQSYYEKRLAVKLVEFSHIQMLEHHLLDQLGGCSPEYWEAKNNYNRKQYLMKASE